MADSLKIVLLLSCFLFPLQPQLVARAPFSFQSQPAIQDSDQNPDARVQLNVIVTDKSGNIVSGLDRSSFTVLDNDVPQPLLSFHADSGASPSDPWQVIFVLDSINTDIRDIARGRTALASFLRRNGGKLPAPTSILQLTQRSAVFSGDPSEDGNLLATDLEAAPSTLRMLRDAAGDEGNVQRDALSLKSLAAIAQLETPKPGRKLVIWIGPGWPYVVGPRISYSNHQLEANFNLIVRLSTELRKARIVLSNVDPRGTDSVNSYESTFYKSLRNGVRTEQDAKLETLGLQVFASQSGGRVLDSGNDLAGEFAACFQDLAASYQLSIAAAPDNPRAPYHKLIVRISQPAPGEHSTARTSAGYYALR